MVKSLVPSSKNSNTKEFCTIYKEHSLKKLFLEVRVGCYTLSYCNERLIELINTDDGTVYYLYRSSIYLGYGYSFINLFFTEREVIYLGKTRRIKRLLLPRIEDSSRFVKVAYRRIMDCLVKNRSLGMGFYFLTLRKDEDIKVYLSRFFYKNSCYRYVSFKEFGGRNKGTFSHQHFILLLPEELKDHITGSDKKFSYIQESNLGRVLNYCLKSSSAKSIKASRNLCIPKLVRLSRSNLESMQSIIFTASPSAFSCVAYTNRVGDSCVKVSVKIDGGLEAKDYKLKMKKKIK
jgi:hypothetical protein